MHLVYLSPRMHIDPWILIARLCLILPSAATRQSGFYIFHLGVAKAEVQNVADAKNAAS
jgi:hypothetical protein